MTSGKTSQSDELFQDVTVAKVAEASGEPTARVATVTDISDSKDSSKQAVEAAEDWAVVVDDSPTVLTVVTGILKGLNMGAHVFRSAGAALKFLNEASEEDLKKITLVISDFQMPEMNGVEFLKEIRGAERLKHLPFVVVSGVIDKLVLSQFVALGVSGYVVKPFKAQVIIDRIMQITVARQKAQGQ